LKSYKDGSRYNTVSTLRLELLEDRCTPTVTYHGGLTLDHAYIQPVFYGAEWSIWNAAHEQTAQLDYVLQDMTQSAWWDVLTKEYGITRPTLLPGQILESSTNGIGWLDDTLIQKELEPYAVSNKLFVVFVEPGVAVSLSGSGANSQNSFAGYHYTDYNGLYYAVIPYPGAVTPSPVAPDPEPNVQLLRSSIFDSLTDVTSHELAEAVTDSIPATGWYDITIRGVGGEVADITQQYTYYYHAAYTVQAIASKNDSPIYASDYLANQEMWI
jgi:hypothetical protein